MKAWVQTVIVVVVLMGVGWLRLPWEQRLTSELKEARILSPSFDVEARAGLNQKSFIASFGGMRPTLAAFVALTSNKYHVGEDWEELEKTFEVAVLLDPYNPYYWDVGAWHMASNAAAGVKEGLNLSPLTRQTSYEAYIEKGSSFYDRGIAVNSQSLKLRMDKAKLWSSPQRIIDFPVVEETLLEALEEVDMSPRHRVEVEQYLFYTWLRMPDRLEKAYALGRRLYVEYPEDRYASLVNGICALQMHPRLKVENPLGFAQLYGTRKNAIRLLTNYSNDPDAYKPKYGVRNLLDRMKEADR